MITISLKQHDKILDVYLRGEGAVFGGGSIALNCNVPPVETIYHIPMRTTAVIPSPPGIQTRFFYPPWDRKWAEDTRIKWRERTDAQVYALPVTVDDIGLCALVFDIARLWSLRSVRPDKKGNWEDTGYLQRIFPNAPTLMAEPLLLMSLRFDEEPGEVSVNFDQPDPPLHNVVTSLFSWNQRGTGMFLELIEEAPLDVADAEPSGMQDAVNMALQLLQVEPPAADQARLLLEPFKSDDND